MCGNPQAVLGVDLREAWDHVFLLCLFFLFVSPAFCMHEYDSIEHKLISFTEMRILHRKPLGSRLSGAATPPLLALRRRVEPNLLDGVDENCGRPPAQKL